MTQPFLRPQGTIVPTLFIGLGGTGSRIVNRIAERGARLPNWDAQLKDLTGFFVLDTNQNDQDRLSTELPTTSRVLIGAVDKRAIVDSYRRAGDRRVSQWLDPRYTPREGINPGAGQVRVESRLGFHVASPEIRQRIEAIIRRLLVPSNTWRTARSRKIYVYLYCTLAGGTGSGSYLPMAYLVQDLVKSLGWEPRIIGNLLLSTTMTQYVKPELHIDIHANAYAALKELEHLTKLQYQEVRAQSPEGFEFVYWNNPHDPNPPKVRSGPFFLSFPIDQPPQSSIDNIEHAVADASFLQLFTPLIDRIAGELDNYEKKLTDLTRNVGANRGIGRGYAKHFGSFGTAVLHVPAAEMVRYSSLKFAAGALRRQLTFNFDSKSRQDLARALSQYAVDYSSEAFRQLDESVRFERINKAFIASVQELARQDKKADRPDGYWNRLVESVEDGPLTGQNDEQGNAIRSESWLARVETLLKAQRDDALRVVDIPEEGLIFHRETYQQWLEIVKRLLQNVRTSQQRMADEKRKIQTAAAEGEAIAALQLDPMQERYLSLLLLEKMQGKWLPEAAAATKASAVDAASNQTVEHKLRDTDFNTLKTASEARTVLLRPDEERFTLAKNQVQSNYKRAIRSQHELFDAEVREAQFRALADYLTARAKLYARLTMRMNALVQDIDGEAESMLRQQDGGSDPRMALSVEAFETLTEPRRRIWAEAFDALFIDDGREYITFDRQRLSAVVAEQLAPAPGPGGRFVPKTDEQVAHDLRHALIALGESQVRGTFYGNPDRPLNVEKALELEARIVLGAAAKDADIDEYVNGKFMALDQMSGVLGRLNTTVGQAADEGVVPFKGRLVLMHPEAYSPGFVKRLKQQVEREGLTPDAAVERASEFNDPHTILVHDIVAAVPLYYFNPIVGVLEGSYETVAGNETRSWNLHIEAAWEHSLPNLNPRKNELAADWSVERLLDGLLSGVVAPIKPGEREFYWIREPMDPFRLGNTFADVLYSLGLVYRDDQLRKSFETATRTKMGTGFNPAEIAEWLGRELDTIKIRKLEAKSTAAERLDEAIYSSLLRLLEERQQTQTSARPSTAAQNPFPTRS
jgi:hypothetical protein